MNKAIRCESKDARGHRCTRKAGHEKIEPTADRPKDVRAHVAFGNVWD